MRPRLTALVDAICVLAFVMIGRESHDEGTFVRGALGTAAPFLIALVIAWLLLLPRWRDDLELWFGAVVAAVTVALGMALRHVVFDRGTALSFIIVALVFNELTMVGWRVGARIVQRRRAADTTGA